MLWEMADISMVNVVLGLLDGMLDFGQFSNAMMLHPKMSKIIPKQLLLYQYIKIKKIKL